jgi:hypothetical protein
MRLMMAVGLVFSVIPQLALAQAAGRETTTGTTTFDVKIMTFDSWCQNTQRYDAERCQARRPEDVKAFEDYRGAVERYELDYLKQVQKERDIRSLTNRDPMATVSGKRDGIP